MRNFNYLALQDSPWASEVRPLVAGVRDCAGRIERALAQASGSELAALSEAARVESTEASNAIEGIRASRARIRELVLDGGVPETLAECAIAGYAEAHAVILECWEAIPVTPNYLLQLHKILFSHLEDPSAGRTKTVQNTIRATYPDGRTETLFTPPAPYETPGLLKEICEAYGEAITSPVAEPLLVIPVFIRDFLAIHPFNDGNGRMSRLLTTLLLLRCGFSLVRYVSLESEIWKRQTLYYEALRAGQAGWHEGRDDPAAFVKFWLEAVLSASRRLEASLGRCGGEQ